MSAEPRVRFLGHSTLVVEIDGLRILTDPALRDRIGPLIRQGPVPESDAYRDIDAVLISHLHLDHLDVPSLRRLDGRPTLIVPRGSEPLMRRSHLHNFVEMAPGEAIAFGGITIRTTKAEHGGARPPAGPIAQAMGFLLEGDRHSVYFAGDTDLFPEMADIPGPDVALLPVSGWGLTRGPGHLDPTEAARALTLVRPRLAIPIHWGTFWPQGLGLVGKDRRTGAADLFRRHAEELAPDVRVAVARPGERVGLPRHGHDPVTR